MEDLKVPELVSAFSSPTFEKDGSFEVDKPVGSMSISPCGRDVVLASRQGLHIIDLDLPWVPPRHLPHHTPWEVADVQWSPFPSRDYWVVSTSNQKALVWNLAMATSQASIEHILHAHTRAITDINFSAHHPDMLATCAVDSFVHCWDLRHPARPALTFCDWYAGATQVKWNRLDPNIIASSHDKFLQIWDKRKGAYPLRTIGAHATKIYGVDWNRIDEHRVATCSLDKTIKFWNYTHQLDQPEHVIETPFPIWRARHTPFGSGILAMPQRGDNDLHLYDRRLQNITKEFVDIEPVHRFEGHHQQVKEFLWRPRGTIENGIDNREFQLVSWGADRILRLHRVDDEILRQVGYEKGNEVHRKFNLTRKNAPYKSFRETPSKLGRSNMKDMTAGPQNNARTGFGIDSQGFRTDTAAMGAPYLSTGWENGDFLTAKPGMHTRVAARVDIEPIAWMKGVKIGRREADLERSAASLSSPSFKVDRNWDNFESLGEEITYVAEKFRNVEFTKIDVARRTVQLSINGPWGVNESSAYVDCHLSFPSNYPSDGTPSFAVEKTASVDAGVIDDLKISVEAISTAYLAHQRASLEAIVRYLQGEQSVAEIIAWTSEEQEDSTLIFTDDREGSSSDEEDDLGSFADKQINDQGLTPSGVLSSSNANATVPVPKVCGAVWAEDGRLICFFPPKEDKAQSLVGSLGLESAVVFSKKKKHMFDGFGNLQTRLQNQKENPTSLVTVESEDNNSDSDSEDSYTSSSHSSAFSQGPSSSRHRFHLTFPFRGDQFHRSRAADESQRSNGSVSVSRSATSIAKSFVSIYTLDDILPAKRSLAKRYSVSGQDICKRNAVVAADEGISDLADVWSLLDLIMRNEVPLDTVADTDSKFSFHVLKRQMTNILQRKTSGIDLSNESKLQDDTTNSLGSIKWGYHPAGAGYLITALFSYFEQLGDVQMLALVSCVLSQYPTVSSDDTSGDKLRRNTCANQDLITLANPKFAHTSSLNLNPVKGQWYWPSYEVAISMHYPAKSPLGAANSGNLGIDLPSVGSSFGALSSDPNTPFSTGQTPPSSYKLERTGFDNPYLVGEVMSTSPERTRLPQRSNSNLASAFAASFPRSFAFSASASSSPPTSFPKKRNSPAESYAANLPPSVTWGATSIFGRSWSVSEEPRSSTTSTTARPETRMSSTRQPNVKIRLKNQDRFGNDGYAAAPLLEYIDEWRIVHYIDTYANQLLIWDLPMVRTEILQYSSKPIMGNGSLKAAPLDTNASIITIGRRTKCHPLAASETPTLYLEKSCEECGKFMELGWGRSAPRCPACRAKSYPLFCALCDMLVRGRVSPCTGCGHILHSACHLLLNSNAKPVRQSSLCISGCDCRCRERLVVDVKRPKESPARVFSAPSTMSGVDEADDIHGADRHTLWEDVAYESLAKNLGVALTKSLKPKSSQIWTGRETRGNSFTK